MDSRRKRHNLLEKYQNIIEELPFQTEDGEDFTLRKYYICPLCLKTFNLEETETIGEVLTLEDVPPKSLGGKPILITCRKCNSTCGHALDAFLLNELELQYGNKDYRLDKIDAVLESHGKKVHSKLRIDEDRTFCFDINRKTNPLNAVDSFVDNVKGDGEKWSINVKLHLKDRKRNVEAARLAVLKSAYLYAFRKLGYWYILNDSLTPVREQILNPQKDILHGTYLIGDQDSVPLIKRDGVYNASVGDRKFLAVVLNLVVPSSSYNCRGVVALPYPGYEEEGLSLYHDVLSGKIEGQRQFRISGLAKLTVRKGDGSILAEIG